MAGAAPKNVNGVGGGAVIFIMRTAKYIGHTQKGRLRGVGKCGRVRIRTKNKCLGWPRDFKALYYIWLYAEYTRAKRTVCKCRRR